MEYYSPCFQTNKFKGFRKIAEHCRCNLYSSFRENFKTNYQRSFQINFQRIVKRNWRRYFQWNCRQRRKIVKIAAEHTNAKQTYLWTTGPENTGTSLSTYPYLVLRSSCFYFHIASYSQSRRVWINSHFTLASCFTMGAFSSLVAEGISKNIS